MSGAGIQLFLHGALAMGCCAAALLFLRFWRLTVDRLFMFFSLAFWAFALNWVELALADPTLEGRHYHFLMRLVGFGFIIWGIFDKNKRRN